jgi:hypothetical protein
MTRGWFRRLPVRHKLVAMIMATSAAVLVLSGAGYLVSTYYQTKADLEQELLAQATVVADSAGVAVRSGPGRRIGGAALAEREPAYTHRVPVSDGRGAPRRVQAARRLAALPRAAGPGDFQLHAKPRASRPAR